MATFQIPSGMLAGRTGIKKVLGTGTLLTSLAVSSVGLVHSTWGLGLLLIVAGIGSSTQHPLSSSAISNVYGSGESRVALSTYNFSGDLGKLAFPTAAGLLIAYIGWRHAISALGLFGLIALGLICAIVVGTPLDGTCIKQRTASKTPFALFYHGRNFSFASLSGIGILDSATRTGFLTFLPFLLQTKGANVRTVGLALGLIFAGGASGKFVCGVLASGVGILRTVVLTELATALSIVCMVHLPLKSALILCPIVGVALNGTSSVLYGTVPELTEAEHRNEAFALFYTCGVGAGAISPVLFGVISDHVGVRTSLVEVAVTVLATIPLTIPLRGHV